MIRYDVDPDELQARVEQHAPGWTARAQTRTEAFRERRRYEEATSIWSEVKPVFMELQGDGKCCFCERKFESGNLGRYELDIEHFRPKGSIGNWPCPQSLIDDGVTLTTPPEANNGYYLLSYNLLNYAVACKPCNSGLKKRYFPIAGAYDANGDDPTEMTAEQPWLIYPIGSLDVDPEDVITFHGFLPQSNAAHPFLMLRGLVTIAFFGLDDVIGRKNLMRERAMTILLLYSQLVHIEEREDTAAARLVDRMLASTASHANCARSFARVFRGDRTRATEIAERVRTFLNSGSL